MISYRQKGSLVIARCARWISSMVRPETPKASGAAVRTEAYELSIKGIITIRGATRRVVEADDFFDDYQRNVLTTSSNSFSVSGLGWLM